MTKPSSKEKVEANAMAKDAAPESNECPNCGAKGNEQCHDTEGPPARFVPRHKSRPRLGDSTPLLWEYQGDGLVLCWRNPYNNDAKETVAMMMWPSHAPEKTEEIEQLYERMAATFVCAWNGQSASAPAVASEPIPAKLPDAAPEELKPCPFCGIVPRIGFDGTAYFISCGGNSCLIRPSISMWDKTETIAAWNTRAAAQPDGWIAVTERLPPDRKPVLVFTKGLSEPNGIRMAAYNKDQPASMFWHGIIMGKGCGVTHWCPLPTPPVQEKP